MSSPVAARARIADLVRWITETVAIVVLAVWGFSEFAFPWPALAMGILAPLGALVLWALFLSPRAVLAIDAFGRALVEIILVSSAALAMVALSWPWWPAVSLVLASTAAGILSGRRSL
ncbi:MAG: YrdB family protein [Agromyces sp.]